MCPYIHPFNPLCPGINEFINIHLLKNVQLEISWINQGPLLQIALSCSEILRELTESEKILIRRNSTWRGTSEETAFGRGLKNSLYVPMEICNWKQILDLKIILIFKWSTYFIDVRKIMWFNMEIKGRTYLKGRLRTDGLTNRRTNVLLHIE